jgi:sugar lactone lactonase YvrE
MRLQATPAAPRPADHGEGPVWDADRQELLWVDITAGRLRRATVSPDGELDELAVHEVGGTVGVAAPAADGGWLLGAGPGFTAVSADGEVSVLVELAGEGGPEQPAGGRPSGTRMNDGGCDRAGRFYAGTMAFDEHPGAGALYRVDLDGTVSTVLDGLTVSNGLGWSPDDRTVYLCDSGAAVVWAFDHDLASGAFGRRRVVLDFSDRPDEGVADGLTVDDEGCLWTALWGGGQVRRYSPDGELLAVVDVPASQTSSCAFAGPGRDLLVISTSAHGLSDDDRAGQPDAGRLFTVRPGMTGPPAFPYRGPLTGLRPVT